MEKRPSALDASAKKMDAVDGQIKGLQQSVSKVEGTQRSLAERIDKLAQHAEKTAAAQAVQQKPSAQGKVHEVRPGETVFSIAKKYNLSAEQFLRAQQYDQEGYSSSRPEGGRRALTPMILTVNGTTIQALDPEIKGTGKRPLSPFFVHGAGGTGEIWERRERSSLRESIPPFGWIFPATEARTPEEKTGSALMHSGFG